MATNDLNIMFIFQICYDMMYYCAHNCGCHKNFPLPIFCPNLIGSNKFGQDDYCCGYLLFNCKNKCTAVLQNQNSKQVFYFLVSGESISPLTVKFLCPRLPAQSGVEINLKIFTPGIKRPQ